MHVLLAKVANRRAHGAVAVRIAHLRGWLMLVIRREIGHLG